MVSGGWAKSLNLPVPTLATHYLDFHMFGDLERVTRLLPEIRGLGRDCTRGLGTVLGCETHRCPPEVQFRQAIPHVRGVPARAIPIVSADVPEAEEVSWPPMQLDLTHCEIRPSATHAPYWHRASVTLCAVPKVRALLELAAA
jgi:hypothetical protein